jgi:zinc transporter ZupT
MTESTSKRTRISQDELLLLCQIEGDKQPSDICCGYASSSVHGTPNGKRDANPVSNYDHHDLEGKVENLENQNLNAQTDEENTFEHSIITQTVLQDKCEASNNINAQNQRLASEQQSSNHEIQDTSTEMTSVIAYLIIIADALHNFLGGLFVGASFVDSTSLGISAWIAAVAHEIPEELGDFGILRHGGWSSQKALFFNFLSALTFPLGGAMAFTASKQIEVSFLIPFAAGNFLYIGGSDLIPEVKHSRGTKQNFIHFVSCLVGVGLMLLIRILI